MRSAGTKIVVKGSEQEAILERRRLAHLASKNRLRARRLASGLCPECGLARSQRSRRFCDKHQALSYSRSKRAVARFRERHRAEGLCKSCVRPIAGDGQKYCSVHQRLGKQYRSKVGKALADSNRCRACRTPKPADGRACPICAPRTRLATARMTARRKKLGLCILCNKRISGALTRCEECADRVNQRRRQRRLERAALHVANTQ